VKRRHERLLANQPGALAVGVAVRAEVPAIVLTLKHGSPKPQLAPSLEGVPLVIEYSSEITP
jgi:hypothetical protein